MSEPDYQILMQTDMSEYNDSIIRRGFKTKLVNLMEKYGRLPWTPAIDFIAFGLDLFVQKEYCA